MHFLLELGPVPLFILHLQTRKSTNFPQVKPSNQFIRRHLNTYFFSATIASTAREPVAGNKLLACGDLYLVSSFLSSSVREVYNSHERIIGIDSYHNIVHMHVGAREQFTYDFPMFHRPITQIGVFSDELLLILSCGELYSIAFSGPSSNSYIRINSPSMIDHFSVSKNEIFIFTSETVPTPALTVYARGYDWFTVDTAQLERIGFESGDRVRAPNDNVATIVGTAFDGSKLCYFDEYTQEIKFSDILSIGTYLFDWRLESRAGADIRNFSFGCGGDLQLDVSAKSARKDFTLSIGRCH
ncbi:uncharacterized protein GO595_001145 [Histomonas meleagridis]|uniref:uncharacterized protein n=1 Tax=Histomonas meleagridis TaxID=135588 RepID=UPI00355A8668|nr:hypothetical protein GO595_001145 [Histomonas meleagridis]